ncbi:NADH dehydrogenase subunit 1 (mitochondrion) [Eublepharis macularius]|uniref:NADH-ubiquinone oxidoreductase chain 1 n=3 Tax=Eublepharis TaxID=96736 RepID=A0A1L7NTX6_EUBMA|nr:NADH dehydrogenase subunit 1 [Eublepharis macularius]WEF49950.1 NADH dehydrogenase subunit 1 [Eublepharis macularius]BAW33373.1 NADH dehydrogenase subunit 1 [Eublepharis macularius]
MQNLLNYIINPLMLIIPILVAVAFLTLLERKLLGYMQQRKGPNLTGPMGLLQPIADGVKLFIKEPIRPTSSSTTLFIIMPTMALMLALMAWTPMPMPTPMSDMNIGLLFILTLSSLTVYSILWSGWASNSKYALLGALRAVAQTISYEVTLTLILLSTIMLVGNFSLSTLITTQEPIWLAAPTWPLMMMWYISTLAETNRAPFDLTEGESELVSGFNVEYAAGPFALFFLAEYTNILMMNTLSCMLFFNSSNTQKEIYPMLLMTKICLLTIGFLWVRASYPRFRYDQLMHLTWKNFLPLTLALLLWYISITVSTASTPPLL